MINIPYQDLGPASLRTRYLMGIEFEYNYSCLPADLSETLKVMQSRGCRFYMVSPLNNNGSVNIIGASGKTEDTVRAA